MAATGSVSITGTITDLPTGDKAIGPVTLAAAAAVAAETQVILASGANTFAIPATATCAIIVFDSTSATVKTLKGVAGDTGIILKPAGCALLSFAAVPPASFVINCSAVDTGLYTTVIFV